MGFHNSSLGSGVTWGAIMGKKSDSYKYMHEQFKIIFMGYCQKRVAGSKDQGGRVYILFRRYQYIIHPQYA